MGGLKKRDALVFLTLGCPRPAARPRAPVFTVRLSCVNASRAEMWYLGHIF